MSSKSKKILASTVKKKPISTSKKSSTPKSSSASKSSSIDLKDWPIYYKDILKVLDPTHHLAICSLWTERQVVEKLIGDTKYNTIGNLYSAQGINAMLRNILANPHIRTIVIWGSEMSLSGHSLLMLQMKGIDTDTRKIIAGKGEIDPEIPDKAIEKFRKYVEVVDMRGRKATEFVAEVQKLSKIKQSAFAKKGERFSEAEVRTRVFPSEQTGFRVQAKTVAQTWLKLLNEIDKYGRAKHTRYSKDNSLKEILNLTAVITDENPDDIYFPEYLPFTRVELEAYYAEMLTSRQVPGVAYNYGKRLRLDLGVDQIEEMKKLLKHRPDSKKMVATTMNPKHDWSEVNNGDTPCLVMVLGSVQDNRFFFTAHFRSQDMVHGWPRNTFALRKLQKDIADSAEIPMGPLTMITHSAHMYADDFGLVQAILAEEYEKELGFTPAVHFAFDPRANVVVSVIDRSKAHVWDEYIKKYETSAVPYAVAKTLLGMPKKGEDRLIQVTIFEPDGGPMIKIFEGRTAQEVAWQISDGNYLVDPGHVMYVGLELQKAEEAIRSGTTYSQDPA